MGDQEAEAAIVWLEEKNVLKRILDSTVTGQKYW
jgi:hypothetical protein